VVEFGNPLPTQAPAESNPADEEVVFSIEDPASGQSALITDALPPEEPDSVEQTSPTENLDSVDNDPPAEFIAIATSTPASENQPADASVLLPSGTVLNLRYPGLDPLELQDGPPWQEVLLVDQPIYDHTGEVLIPAGSEVIGRFEISSRGSRFIAQAITLNGQNIRLAGSSERQSSVIQPDQIVEVRLTAAISRQN
jgi:N-acetylmuramoyl-L-alanine amidase